MKLWDAMQKAEAMKRSKPRVTASVTKEAAVTRLVTARNALSNAERQARHRQRHAKPSSDGLYLDAYNAAVDEFIARTNGG